MCNHMKYMYCFYFHKHKLPGDIQEITHVLCQSVFCITSILFNESSNNQVYAEQSFWLRFLMCNVFAATNLSREAETNLPQRCCQVHTQLSHCKTHTHTHTHESIYRPCCKTLRCFWRLKDVMWAIAALTCRRFLFGGTKEVFKIIFSVSLHSVGSLLD